MNVTRVEKSNINNTIVDFTDIDILLPVNVRWDTQASKKYNDSYIYNTSHLRTMGVFDNNKEVDEWIVNFVHTQILPTFIEDQKFNQAYPHSLEFLKDNMVVGATLIRDSVGYTQPIHIDPQWNILAGAIHLQDSPDNGTAFQRKFLNTGDWELTHRSPSNKFSGSVWANMGESYHGVTTVTSERLLYLIVGTWKLANLKG